MKKLKSIQLIFVLFTFINVFSQEPIFGKVNYKQVTNFAYLFEKDYLLIFDQKKSIYKEEKIIKGEQKIKKVYDDNDLIIKNEIARNNLTPEFCYNDKKDFYFMEIWFDKELLVKDEVLNWDWNISNETKNIGVFLCQKGTTKFRGRNYIAWFTNEIPTSFGPWKFNGLPGLILEIYDTEYKLHIQANNIVINKENKYPIEIDKSNFKNVLNIQKFAEKKEGLLKNDFKIMNSKLPKGNRNLVFDKNCEDCNSQQIEIFPEIKRSK